MLLVLVAVAAAAVASHRRPPPPPPPLAGVVFRPPGRAVAAAGPIGLPRAAVAPPVWDGADAISPARLLCHSLDVKPGS